MICFCGGKAFGSGAGCGLRLALQFAFHSVEGQNVGFFPLRGLLAGEAHCQKHKAVFGDFIAGLFFALLIDVRGLLKIKESKLRRAFKFCYSLDYVVVAFVKMLGDSNGSGFDFSVNDGKVWAKFGCDLGLSVH